MIAMKIVSTQMKCQMKVNLPGIEFLVTEPKLRIRKKNSLWCVYVRHKMSRERISRSSRAVMVCCTCRVMILLIKRIALLISALSLPSSMLKLP